jgi:hypothetical protein
MKSIEDNPYPKTDTTPIENLTTPKNSFLRGFFIGWCTNIISMALVTLSFWSLEEMIKSVLGYHVDWVFVIIPVSVIGACIWFVVKRCFRTAFGALAALASAILFAALAVSIVFALF